MTLPVIVVVATLACSGSAAPQEPPEQPVTPTPDLVTIERGKRSALVHVPAGLDDTPVPLVLMFHGGRGTSKAASEWWKDQFNEGFVLAFPQGQRDDPKQSAWFPVSGELTEHVQFVDQLIDDLLERYPIDRQRIYAAGFSDGGQMAFRLACASTQPIAGFAVVGQTLKRDTLADCQPRERVPMLLAIGSKDPRNPSGGRESRSEHGVARIGTEATLDHWLTHNGCDKAASVSRQLPDVSTDNTRVDERTYTACSGGAVRYLNIEGGGHSWPTLQVKGGAHCSDIDGAEQALSFWKAFARFDG